MEGEIREMDQKERPVEKDSAGGQSLWELVRFAIIALVAVFLVRAFIIQPFIVSGSSMVPTFENGEYLIIDEISYRFNEPERNDVIVFKYPNDKKKFFIKRIIGLPNETVEIKESTVTIYNDEHKDGFKLEQPFVKNDSKNSTRVELKDDEYFVMGDNRSASSDSRYWGAVKKDLIVGKAFIRLWPINRIDITPGLFKQAE